MHLTGSEIFVAKSMNTGIGMKTGCPAMERMFAILSAFGEISPSYRCVGSCSSIPSFFRGYTDISLSFRNRKEGPEGPRCGLLFLLLTPKNNQHDDQDNDQNDDSDDHPDDDQDDLEYIIPDGIHYYIAEHGLGGIVRLVDSDVACRCRKLIDLVFESVTDHNGRLLDQNGGSCPLRSDFLIYVQIVILTVNGEVAAPAVRTGNGIGGSISSPFGDRL